MFMKEVPQTCCGNFNVLEMMIWIDVFTLNYWTVDHWINSTNCCRMMDRYAPNVYIGCASDTYGTL